MSPGDEELRVAPLDIPEPAGDPLAGSSQPGVDLDAALAKIEQQQRELEAIRALLLEQKGTSQLTENANSEAEAGQWPGPTSVPVGQALPGIPESVTPEVIGPPASPPPVTSDLPPVMTAPVVPPVPQVSADITMPPVPQAPADIAMPPSPEVPMPGVAAPPVGEPAPSAASQVDWWAEVPVPGPVEPGSVPVDPVPLQTPVTPAPPQDAPAAGQTPLAPGDMPAAQPVPKPVNPHTDVIPPDITVPQPVDIPASTDVMGGQGPYAPADPHQPGVVPPLEMPTPADPASGPQQPDPYASLTPPAPQPEPADPYAGLTPPAPQPEPTDPYAGIAPAEGVASQDPYQQVAERIAAPAENPLDRLMVQDALRAVGQRSGTTSEALDQGIALGDLVAQTREGRREERSKRKNKRRGRPQFLPVRNVFRPNAPLVVTFTSPKGGVGKSTTAANYAGYMAMAAHLSGLGDQVRVLLVDGDVANGNVALRVAQKLSPNMVDLLDHMDNVRKSDPSVEYLQDYQRDIKPWMLSPVANIPNLDVLAAPENPDVINVINQSDLEFLMRTFAHHYQVVVFDSGTQIIEHTNMAWMYFSDQVYCMVEPEIACLQMTAEHIKRAKKLKLLQYERCRVVCIRADLPLHNMNAQKVVGDLFSVIPPTRQFFIQDFHASGIDTANAGELLVLEDAEYAAALTDLIKASLESYERQQASA